jgi:hypothetical protein
MLFYYSIATIVKKQQNKEGHSNVERVNKDENCHRTNVLNGFQKKYNIKKSSTFLAIKELKIKTSLRFYLT